MSEATNGLANDAISQLPSKPSGSRKTSVVAWIVFLNCFVFATYSGYTANLERQAAIQRYEKSERFLGDLVKRVQHFESLKVELGTLAKESTEISERIYQLNGLSSRLNDFIILDDEQISSIVDEPNTVSPNYGYRGYVPEGRYTLDFFMSKGSEPAEKKSALKVAQGVQFEFEGPAKFQLKVVPNSNPIDKLELHFTTSKKETVKKEIPLDAAYRFDKRSMRRFHKPGLPKFPNELDLNYDMDPHSFRRGVSIGAQWLSFRGTDQDEVKSNFTFFATIHSDAEYCTRTKSLVWASQSRGESLGNIPLDNAQQIDRVFYVDPSNAAKSVLRENWNRRLHAQEMFGKTVEAYGE